MKTVERLQKENAELNAQLKMIRKIFRDESLSEAETMRKLSFVIDSAPEQCLAELKAEAGRAGFVACIRLAYALQHPPGVIHADQYADNIRSGATT